MFSMICQSCHKQQEPYLEKDTDVVYCSECDKEMNVNHFTKTQMRNMKQYRTTAPSITTIKCNKCKKTSSAKVINKDLCCGSCKEPLSHLTSYFKSIIMDQLKQGSDIGSK